MRWNRSCDCTPHLIYSSAVRMCKDEWNTDQVATVAADNFDLKNQICIHKWIRKHRSMCLRCDESNESWWKNKKQNTRKVRTCNNIHFWVSSVFHSLFSLAERKKKKFVDVAHGCAPRSRHLCCGASVTKPNIHTYITVNARIPIIPIALQPKTVIVSEVKNTLHISDGKSHSQFAYTAQTISPVWGYNEIRRNRYKCICMNFAQQLRNEQRVWNYGWMLWLNNGGRLVWDIWATMLTAIHLLPIKDGYFVSVRAHFHIHFEFFNQ